MPHDHPSGANLRVLAVASAGGHLVQLRRLRPAWDGMQLSYITTSRGFEAEIAADARARGQEVPRVLTVPDASLDAKLRLVAQMLAVVWHVLRLRPHVVVSTGAAPGYFAIRAARLIGARTIWVDSIANAEHLSTSGQRVGKHCHVWLTQWEDLAETGGPEYAGAVL